MDVVAKRLDGPKLDTTEPRLPVPSGLTLKAPVLAPERPNLAVIGRSNATSHTPPLPKGGSGNVSALYGELPGANDVVLGRARNEILDAAERQTAANAAGIAAFGSGRPVDELGVAARRDILHAAGRAFLSLSTTEKNGCSSETSLTPKGLEAAATCQQGDLEFAVHARAGRGDARIGIGVRMLLGK